MRVVSLAATIDVAPIASFSPPATAAAVGHSSPPPLSLPSLLPASRARREHHRKSSADHGPLSFPYHCHPLLLPDIRCKVSSDPIRRPHPPLPADSYHFRLQPMQPPSPLPSCPPIHSNTAAASRCLLLPIVCFLLFPAPINRLQPTLSSSSPAVAPTAVAHSYFVLCCRSNRTLLPPLPLLPPPPSVACNPTQQRPPLPQRCRCCLPLQRTTILCHSVTARNSVAVIASYCNAQPSYTAPAQHRQPLSTAADPNRD
ncbi:hypothetical protein B296_00020466 [Ensete ventricosum]|uniref:Uncharacterized protein n=1 Tax=Ensete ventricosum TaxID=4639 RepID=A0A427A526_ENSVE|nr:hypothetical protein B296_00020466 [Ensete ventricosum]